MCAHSCLSELDSSVHINRRRTRVRAFHIYFQKRVYIVHFLKKLSLQKRQQRMSLVRRDYLFFLPSLVFFLRLVARVKHCNSRSIFFFSQKQQEFMLLSLTLHFLVAGVLGAYFICRNWVYKRLPWLSLPLFILSRRRSERLLPYHPVYDLVFFFLCSILICTATLNPFD